MDINQTEDLKLLAQLENDNEKAFDHLFAKYYPGLIRFCKSLLNSSGDEAEDVVQAFNYLRTIKSGRRKAYG